MLTAPLGASSPTTRSVRTDIPSRESKAFASSIRSRRRNLGTTTNSLESECPTTYAASSTRNPVLMGTTTPPSLATAKYRKTHSGRFGIQIETRSPAPTPSAINPRAMSSTRSASSRNVIRLPSSRTYAVRSANLATASSINLPMVASATGSGVTFANVRSRHRIFRCYGELPSAEDRATASELPRIEFRTAANTLRHQRCSLQCFQA